MAPSERHQTIRLSAGRHAGPHDGACVMELASMLAGESFSDHPACASPVVAALLRMYNDFVDSERRQTLYGCAAAVVGTGGSPEDEHARAWACKRWMDEVVDEPGRSRWARWRLSRTARRGATANDEAVGSAAGRFGAMLARLDGDVGHARVLALVDRLIKTRRAAPPRPRAVTAPAAPAADPR